MKSQQSTLAILAACLLMAPVGAAPSNPVARVVGLMKELAAKIEAEGKTEEGLYEDFVCWGKSVISGKTASNKAASARIEELLSVIADLDSGKTELTSERTDLEKDIKTLNEEQEAATAQRKSELAAFEAAESDMNLAIAALEEAIEVLGNATKDHKEGTLLSIRTQVSRGMAAGGLAALQKRTAVLNKATELGDQLLHHGDAEFLRRLLTGDVPTVDWKKLNRKATFRMSYKARSFKIQATLAEMLKTFETNLADARATEKSDLANYDSLMTAKNGQLDAAQTAYGAMAKEKGAKAISRQDASDEVAALEAQITADNGFISQTQTDLSTKTGEWKTRKELRAGELAAISKTISILHNDDARDLFKKSFTSQGYQLLQESATVRSSERSRLHQANTVLRQLASVTKDRRLLALAPFSEAEKTAIAPAIEAIDTLIAKLSADEADDLAKKEKCETERAEDTRSAILKARLVDEKTDAITELTDNIEELIASILATETNMNETKAELAEATDNRNAENKEYESDMKDDQDAADTVVMAKTALKEFYTKNDLMLLQQPVATVAGEAPTAPPDTWTGAYMGATDDTSNILALLEMIHEDITKDMTKAQADEAAAEAAYGKFKKLSEDSIKADEGTISKLEGTKGEKEVFKVTATTQRSLAKDDLNKLLATIKMKASSGCDYFAVNYKLRLSNRQLELDGLTKAKAYLQGGEFSKIDPNREMTPGDAVLFQKKLRR
mmetsp:Transcript_122418/g.216758  ORF Transcript_122418/g.216758 Transcript_122418/m.216758 type:complete len:731 (-) Transcript_122418:114-2306(-)